MTVTVESTPTAEQERAVLDALKQAGGRGVHTHEIRRRLFIANPAERVRRLRNAGWAIDSTREKSPFGGKSWGTRYRLHGRLSVPGGGVIVEEKTELGRQLRLEPGVAPLDVELPRAA